LDVGQLQRLVEFIRMRHGGPSLLSMIDLLFLICICCYRSGSCLRPENSARHDRTLSDQDASTGLHDRTQVSRY